MPAPGWMVWTALGVVYVVWGSTYLAIRVMVQEFPPLLASGVRFVLASALLAVWFLITGRRGRLGVSRGQLAAMGTIGAVLIFGANGALNVAEQEVPSGLSALIIAAVPLWVIVCRRVTKERVATAAFAGVAFGFLGVALLVVPGPGQTGAPLGWSLLVVLSSFLWASGSFAAKYLPVPDDALVSTTYQMLFGGILTLLTGLALGEANDVHLGDVAAAAVGAFAYLVLVGSLLAFTAYVWLLRHAPISKVATYAYVNPVVAIFLGWALLSERITPVILAGAAIVVASVAFTVRHESQPQTAPVDGERP